MVLFPKSKLGRHCVKIFLDYYDKKISKKEQVENKQLKLEIKRNKQTLPKMSIEENKKYLAGLREKAKLSWSGVDLDKFLNEMRRD
ncbi:MAG: hypothetical protein KKE64_08190 [Candidatus Omnitrophica bacterium]|nr:hypothetical protein [Candidatus Omnitrophota bacterium]